MNCFDDPDGEFLALVNDNGQLSLWPGVLGVPPGWQVVAGPVPRRDCLDYLEQHTGAASPRDAR